MNKQLKYALPIMGLLGLWGLIAWSHGTPDSRAEVKARLRRMRRCPKGKWDRKRERCRVQLCPGRSC